MKNLLKNLALAACILVIAVPAFAAKKKWALNKDGTADIELWYGAAVTEAAPLLLIGLRIRLSVKNSVSTWLRLRFLL